MTDFQQQALRATAAIPYGETALCSLSQPDWASPAGASRWAGGATNPMPLVIPCHACLEATVACMAMGRERPGDKILAVGARARGLDLISGCVKHQHSIHIRVPIEIEGLAGFILLGTIWGSSFLWIKIAVQESGGSIGGAAPAVWRADAAGGSPVHAPEWPRRWQVWLSLMFLGYITTRSHIV